MRARSGSGGPASHRPAESSGLGPDAQEAARVSPAALARQSFPAGFEAAMVQQVSRLADDPPYQQLAEDIASRVSERSAFPSGGMAVLVERVRFANGAEAVHKIVRQEREADCEALASLVGGAIGAPVPAVYQASPRELYIEFMPGIVAMELVYSREEEQPYIDSWHGLLLGVLDASIDNWDRTVANWLIADDDTICGIDHSLAFIDPGEPDHRKGTVQPGEGAIRSAFSRRWLVQLDDRGVPGWKDNVLHPADVDLWLPRVLALEPDFEQRGYADHWRAVVGRLRAIRYHAKGPQPWVAAAALLSSPSQAPTATSSRPSRSRRRAR
jgi:tRNA A-37 threonylcarbamoyl transferase component Bud32